MGVCINIYFLCYVSIVILFCMNLEISWIMLLKKGENKLWYNVDAMTDGAFIENIFLFDDYLEK
jgi:hypothetical protein